jgi:putative endonuclease
MENREVGRRGEAEARRYLEGRGYEILESNWRGGSGEIDLIARRGPVCAFVEVKTRRTATFGSPEESVTKSKISRIRGVAAEYIASSGLTGEVRFDVVSIRMSAKGDVLSLEHLVAAF